MSTTKITLTDEQIECRLTSNELMERLTTELDPHGEYFSFQGPEQ